jgi:hypothetical protein
MPVLVKYPDGRLRPLESDDASKVEAVKRAGENEIRAYVVQDP